MTDVPVNDVCAVVVSYRPEPDAMVRLVDAVMPQVGAVVLVDNASDGDWNQVLGRRLSAQGGAMLSQSRNLGLAAAQNVGIAWARERGYRHILLLDQDSEPAEGMVVALLRALQELSLAGPVAAVGPRFHDMRERRAAPFVRIGFPFNRKLWCDGSTPTIACDFLISSGTLIPLAVFDRIGAMDAGLFIDNVDLEWSFRARARKLHSRSTLSMNRPASIAPIRSNTASGISVPELIRKSQAMVGVEPSHHSLRLNGNPMRTNGAARRSRMSWKRGPTAATGPASDSSCNARSSATTIPSAGSLS